MMSATVLQIKSMTMLSIARVTKSSILHVLTHISKDIKLFVPNIVDFLMLSYNAWILARKKPESFCLQTEVSSYEGSTQDVQTYIIVLKQPSAKSFVKFQLAWRNLSVQVTKVVLKMIVLSFFEEVMRSKSRPTLFT